MDRFPDYESLVEAKLMLPSEVKRLEKTDERTPHESTWAPISWAMKLITLGKWMKKATMAFFYTFLQKLTYFVYVPSFQAGTE